MRGMLPALAAVLAVASCGTQPAVVPQGPAGDAQSAAVALVDPNAQISDFPFEDAIAHIDFAKIYGARGADILDQVKKTRAAVEKRGTSSASHGARLASVGGVVGTFSFAAFRADFAFQLDDRTAKGGSVSYPVNPFSSTQSGADTTTTTTLTVTEVFVGQKSVVTATVHWSYSTITLDTSASGNGATLFHLTDDRDFEGKIDVCPDAGGNVPATLKTSAKITSETSAGATGRTSDGNSSFKGSVNDQASLTSVSQQSRFETSSDSAAGNGRHAENIGATWNASNSSISSLASGSFNVTFELNGNATASEAAKAAGWDTALGIFAIEPAYLAARDLWQRGRCVIVAVPEYSAETPLAIQEQQKPQHDEAVDTSSETQFSVKLKHRFDGGTPSAPVTSSLSGQKTLEPGRIDSGSGTLTYKAPDEEDKKATATLKSTSRRGISVLVLDFHTGGPLTLTIKGELTAESTRLGTVKILDIVNIGPLEFKPWVGDMWQATGSWSADTSSLTFVAGSTDTCTGADHGQITLIATVETRAGKRVWVIDPGGVDVQGTGTTTCVSSQGDQTLRGVTIPGTRTFDSDGGSAEQFMSNLNPFTIPAEGGTVHVHGSDGAFTSDGTAIAKK